MCVCVCVCADVRDCSGDGGATLTEPQGGFAHPAVYTMFHPPPPSTSTAASSSSASSLSGGAIAGAVVGSVAGVALAVLAGWWVLGRRREARRRRRHSVGRSTLSELQGNAAEIHEKPAVPVEPAAVYVEPQELEAVERAELPVAGSLVAEKKKEGTPSPRQSAFIEHTEEEEDEEEERRRRDRKDEQGK